MEPAASKTDAFMVSVIIPVFNAARYVQQAVESALTQPETGEVILIEDASEDDSLAVCRELAGRYPKVKLLRHRDGENRGAAASRNLGIRQATCPFIGFLDADDFYLPDRYDVPRALLQADPDIDGVYEAVEVYFEDEASRARVEPRLRSTLFTMAERVEPERLFESQAPVGRLGWPCTLGWVVRRSVFETTGLFDEHLRLHQDTALFVKFAALCRMAPGRLRTPVAMYRIHARNRSTANRPSREVYRARIMMWGTLWRWGKRNLEARRSELLLRKLLNYASRPHETSPSASRAHLVSVGQMALLTLSYPGLVAERLFWRQFAKTGRKLLGRMWRRLRGRSKKGESRA